MVYIFILKKHIQRLKLKQAPMYTCPSLRNYELSFEPNFG